MIQVIRYLKGYLSIRVSGFSPERFMNLCSHHNIFLWDIIDHGSFYTMKISLKGFYRLKGITRKTGTRVVITKRYGLLFLSVRMWKRRIFLLGLLGSLLFWMVMSQFIWSIETEGNYYITSDVLQDFLAQNGFEVGMKKGDVDIEALEKAIRAQFDLVTWTSARIDGTRLLVRIRENDLIGTEEPKPNQKDKGRGMDLVAEKDGVIISIVTRSGVPVVKEGMEVKKGDILVEGGVPILGDDGAVSHYDFCVADADVMLQCIYKMQEKLDENYEKKQYTGRESRRPFVMIGTHKFGLPVFTGKYEQADKVEEKNQLRIFNNYALPVYAGYDLVREYTTENKVYTKEEVKFIFQDKVQKFIETLEEKGVQIIEKNVTIKKATDAWILKVDFLAVEQTGTEKATHLEQVDEASEMSETMQ